MTTYTTVQGDMWDSIAHKVYGNPSCMPALMEANPKWRQQFIFPAGVEIVVPDVEKPITPDELPPWRRGTA